MIGHVIAENQLATTTRRRIVCCMPARLWTQVGNEAIIGSKYLVLRYRTE